MPHVYRLHVQQHQRALPHIHTSSTFTLWVPPQHVWLELHLVNRASRARNMIQLPELRQAVKPTACSNQALYLVQHHHFCPNIFSPRLLGLSPSLATNVANNITLTPTSDIFMLFLASATVKVDSTNLRAALLSDSEWNPANKWLQFSSLLMMTG